MLLFRVNAVGRLGYCIHRLAQKRHAVIDTGGKRLGALPGTVTLLQISEDGYTVQQLLYAEGEMRALYDAETGYTVWRAEPRLRFDSGVNP